MTGTSHLRMAGADVRHRLGECAGASRLLSTVIASAAVAFNWLFHYNRLVGGFFASMSAMGYLVCLDSRPERTPGPTQGYRDARCVPPAYDLIEHHPSNYHFAHGL